MKKLVLVMAVVLAGAPAAFAGNGKANTGCGLGTMLFGDNMDDSILLQSLAVTTNGTSANQTFGITSGTSECEQPSSFVMNERVREFIQANLDNLARDIAQGQGESLDALADLMEIPAAERSEVYETLQAHFDEIFPTAQVEYAHVADAIARLTAQG